MKEKELVGFSSVSNEELVNVDGGVSGVLVRMAGGALIGGLGYLVDKLFTKEKVNFGALAGAMLVGALGARYL